LAQAELECTLWLQVAHSLPDATQKMTFAVFIYGLSGEAICTLDAGLGWTVRNAKVAAEAVAEVAVQHQRLLIGAVEPGDCERLANYLPHGSNDLEVTLVRRPPEQAEWLARVEADWHCLRKAPGHIRADSDVVLKAVQIKGRALRYAAPEPRADRDVVLAAVRQEGAALRYASAELRADPEVASLAVSGSPSALIDAADELQRDRDFVLGALQADPTGSVLRYAKREIRSDRDMVLAAVRRSWRALEHIPERFLSDSEVVNAAVLQNLEALKYVAATVGLQTGVPPNMLELCRGRRSEFGAKVVFQNELCTAAPHGSQLAGLSTRGAGSASSGPAPPSKSATPRHGSSLRRVPTPLSVSPSTRSAMQVFVDGGIRVIAAGTSRATSCEPSPQQSGGMRQHFRPRTPQRTPRPRSTTLPPRAP